MRFTLVIPVAPERNAEIIESIKKLDYPRSEFHVVIVNGRNTSNNRNRGAGRALGEYIVFLDDDGTIEKDYLQKVDKFLIKHPEIVVVGGPQLTPKDEIGFAKISGYALSSKFGAWKLSNRYSCNEEICDADETCLTSANLICKKEVMEKVEFDINLFPGEDPKFIADCKKARFKIGYSPEIILYHRRRANIGMLIKQIFNYGKVRPIKESFFETLRMPFFFVPSLFLIYLVLLIGSILINPSITGNVVGSGFSNRLEFWWFLPLFVYMGLSLVFGVYDSIKNNHIRAIGLLPGIYLIIHLSYGSGMIWGYLVRGELLVDRLI